LSAIGLGQGLPDFTLPSRPLTAASYFPFVQSWPVSRAP